MEEGPVQELGVGTGVLLAEGLGQGRKMRGVDASERMLTQAGVRGGLGSLSRMNIILVGRALPLAGEVYGSVMATSPTRRWMIIAGRGSCVGDHRCG